MAYRSIGSIINGIELSQPKKDRLYSVQKTRFQMCVHVIKPTRVFCVS